MTYWNETSRATGFLLSLNQMSHISIIPVPNILIFQSCQLQIFPYLNHFSSICSNLGIISDPFMEIVFYFIFKQAVTNQSGCENLSYFHALLTHWSRVTHICICKLTIIGSDNGLSPERRQAIIWTNAGILLIGPLGTNFSEILIEIQTFSLKKIRLKMSSVKCCSFRLGLNVLTHWPAGDVVVSLNQ